MYDPDSTEFQADPYKVYAALRAGPASRSEGLGIWIASRYDDVDRLLRDRRLTSDASAWELYPEVVEAVYGSEQSPLVALQRSWIMSHDGETHKHGRAALLAALNRARLERAYLAAEACAKSVARELKAGGERDLVDAVARRAPLAFICDLLGISWDDGRRCQVWFDSILSTFGLGRLSVPQRCAAEEAAANVLLFFEEILSGGARRSEDDGLSAFRDACPVGTSTRELASNAALLFAAGHQTTAYLIASVVWLCLREEGWWERLGVDPSIAMLVVDEALRLESPVQVVSRVAIADVPLGLNTVRTGEQLACLIGAANRDEKQFADPDRFDPMRRERSNLSFATGVHRCIGAHAARAEVARVLAALAETLPSLHLTKAPRWERTASHRGLCELWVTV